MKRVARSLALGILLASPAAAQPVAVDRGVRAGGLWCFPLVGDDNTYVYVPAAARLAQDEQGRPGFSLVRYVADAASTEGAASLTRAAGGGVLHFLVELHTPPEQVSAAERELRETLRPALRERAASVALRGPLVFGDGRYALVSSVLRAGRDDKELLTGGRAPVLEGNRLAFSFHLDPERTTLLLASLQTATPDVSLVFDMTFTGLTDAYQARLTVDWEEVRKSETFSAGASAYFVGADVEAAFDALRRDHAIRLDSRGSDATMEGLLATVYDRLLQMLFRPVEPDRVPEDKRGGLADALGALLDARGGLSGRKTTGFGAYVGYQLKDIRSSGVSVLDFNHRSTVERHAFVTFNIGDLYRRHGTDPQHFRTVSLDDAAFQQREIHVAVDGALLPELERTINSVTLTLRKRHANGEETLRELVLDRRRLDAAPGELRLVYGWKGDDDRLAWLQYDYRTRWSFKGGGSYATDWRRSDAPMIDLFAPYERRLIEVTGDPAVLARRAVRAVVVEVDFPFFGERRHRRLVVRPDQPWPTEPLEVTLPLGDQAYDYAITWHLAGDRRQARRGRERGDLLFLDEVPEGPALPGPDPDDESVPELEKET